MNNYDNELQFCATKLERSKLKTLRDIAFERHITLKALLYQILTDFAKKHIVEVNAS